MTKDRAKIKAGLYLEWAAKAEKKSQTIMQGFTSQYKDYDWTQPILLGHHSQRRSEKVHELRYHIMRVSIELDMKAKRFREKADNLLRFANTHKGDAERRRAQKREEIAKCLTIGAKVIYCGTIYEVVKINQKTARIKNSNWTLTEKIDFLTIYEEHIN